MPQFRIVTTPDLVKKSPSVKLIDVRPAEAYNGWSIHNEPRGGHIKGARSLPAKWIQYMDWIEIVRYKGLLPKDELIIYGYTPEETKAVAAQFKRYGYRNVGVYNNFLREWVHDDSLPMENLPRYRQLVSPKWINDLILKKNPQELNNKKFLIVHAHYRNREAYLSGHIPGAVDMDTNVLESQETWNRREPSELKQALEEHGITADTTVVLYGKFMHPDNNDEFPGSAAGDIGAIRCAFIMMYAGVQDVRVLNGGFQSWEDAGFEVSTKDVRKTPVEGFGAEIPARPELAVDILEAKEILESQNAELVSVRSYREYIGEVSGYNYIEAKGRIPGSLFADCGSDAYHMENYRNVDLTTREYHEIEKMWRDNGITPEKHLAFYCGTGWRGSEAWFNAWLMGWPRVSVFDGGWFEWSNDSENPRASGIPKEKQIQNPGEAIHGK